MQKLWKYTINNDLTNKNAGYSMWGFANKGGREYFIKQFLSPKYPAQDTQSSPEFLETKKQRCRNFVANKKEIYKVLNENSDGNNVRILDFFRVESCYYVVTEKIDALPWTVEMITALSESERRRLCRIIAHAVAAFHKGHLIHADLKHENILYTKTQAGSVTAKIIDFDSSFLESSPPAPGEEITGDFNYFAPEVCARSFGVEVPLSCKMDIFALGVLFHQYYTGSLPIFDQSVYSCPGEASLRGEHLDIDEKQLPQEIGALLRAMLNRNPNRRPTAAEVCESLCRTAASSPQSKVFFRAGDL